jgi:uncharacterized small protein (DUF1192 family)
MPFDINGNFKRVKNWRDDAQADIKIMADRHDEEDDNFAEGLSQCLTRDGKGKLSDNFDFNNYKGVSLRAGAKLNDAANVEQVINGINFAVDNGVKNKIKIDITPAIESYKNGQRFFIKIAHGNDSGDVTINVCDLGEIPVLNMQGRNIPADNLETGAIAEFVYMDGSFRLMQGLQPNTLPLFARFYSDELLEGTLLGVAIAGATVDGKTYTTAYNRLLDQYNGTEDTPAAQDATENIRGVVYAYKVASNGRRFYDAETYERRLAAVGGVMGFVLDTATETFRLPCDNNYTRAVTDPTKLNGYIDDQIFNTDHKHKLFSNENGRHNGSPDSNSGQAIQNVGGNREVEYVMVKNTTDLILGNTSQANFNTPHRTGNEVLVRSHTAYVYYIIGNTPFNEGKIDLSRFSIELERLENEKASKTDLETVANALTDADNEINGKIEELSRNSGDFYYNRLIFHGVKFYREDKGYIKDFEKYGAAELPELFRPYNRNWYLKVNFKTTDDTDTKQAILGSFTDNEFCVPKIFLENSRLRVLISKSGTAWDLLDITSNFEVEPNRECTAILRFEGNKYVFESGMRENINFDWQHDTNDIMFQGHWGRLYLGNDRLNDDEPAPFKGLVYPYGCHIDINGGRWWDFEAYALAKPYHDGLPYVLRNGAYERLDGFSDNRKANTDGSNIAVWGGNELDKNQVSRQTAQLITDPQSEQTGQIVYRAVSKNDDNKHFGVFGSYIYKSHDKGKTWENTNVLIDNGNWQSPFYPNAEEGFKDFFWYKHKFYAVWEATEMGWTTDPIVGQVPVARKHVYLFWFDEDDLTQDGIHGGRILNDIGFDNFDENSRVQIYENYHENFAEEKMFIFGKKKMWALEEGSEMEPQEIPYSEDNSLTLTKVAAGWQQEWHADEITESGFPIICAVRQDNDGSMLLCINFNDLRGGNYNWVEVEKFNTVFNDLNFCADKFIAIGASGEGNGKPLILITHSGFTWETNYGHNPEVFDANLLSHYDRIVWVGFYLLYSTAGNSDASGFPVMFDIFGGWDIRERWGYPSLKISFPNSFCYHETQNRLSFLELDGADYFENEIGLHAYMGFRDVLGINELEWRINWLEGEINRLNGVIETFPEGIKDLPKNTLLVKGEGSSFVALAPPEANSTLKFIDGQISWVDDSTLGTGGSGDGTALWG